MKLITPLLLLTAVSALTPCALRAEDTPAKPAETSAKLDTGAKAPEFKPTAWIQGEPVKAFEAGKVYLVECWATWCGPCVAQIPHLNALHKKYAGKGLVIIGTNVWDKDEKNAADFVKKKGDGMGYRVAFDNKADGQVTAAWLKAAGVNGIPHAFVVRDGVIIWHGHPGSLNDGTIESMLAGTFDSAKMAAEQKSAQEAQVAALKKLNVVKKEIAALIAAKDYDGALKKTDELEAIGPRFKSTALLQRVSILVKKGDVAAVVQKVRDAVKADDGLALKYNLEMALLREKAVVADKAGSALVVELADAMAKDPEHGSDSVLKLLGAQAHYAAGDKTGALAKLGEVAALPEANESLKGYVAKCEAAVKAGEDWPARTR